MVRIEYLIDREELIQELARLSIQEWFYLNPMITLEAQIIILRDHCGHRQIPTILVATTGDEILGSAALVAHDMDTRKSLSPWMSAVYVKPAYRRKGIATLLIGRIEKEAYALGIQRLYPNTANAEAFYSRLGWRFIERCANKGIMVSVMKKNLVPNL
ncbi:MAG: GNAT family N-acetyltransferase [Desulfobacteraceae bacterium]|jgi:GNAT superfamily N-acetyltransferase